MSAFSEQFDTRSLVQEAPCAGVARVQEARRQPGPRGPVRAIPEYKVWREMMRRCSVPTAGSYAYYGARGVSVCERWRADFWTFYDDMGPRPSDRHSIDRVDNAGNYEPANCRWATRVVQRQNMRDPYAGRRVAACASVLPVLTASQRRWTDAIASCVAAGQTPTIRRLNALVGCTSTNAAADMLGRLERKGAIRWIPR